MSSGRTLPAREPIRQPLRGAVLKFWNSSVGQAEELLVSMLDALIVPLHAPWEFQHPRTNAILSALDGFRLR